MIYNKLILSCGAIKGILTLGSLHYFYNKKLLPESLSINEYLKYKDDEYLITNSRNQLGDLYLKLKQI